MKLKYPRMVVRAKEPYAYSGNRLNGIFLSSVMSDNDSVRKLIHEQNPHAKRILNALYEYYKNNDKQQLLDAIRPKDDEYLRACGIGVGYDRQGNEILIDWSCRYTGEESLWADLSLYDEKQNIDIFDEMGRPRRRKSFENVSVAEVLEDTVHNRSCYVEHCPQTDNEELDVLIKNLWNNQNNEELDKAVYYKAVKKINKDLIDSFEDRKDADARKYIPAIIMLDNESTKLFNNMEYREQFGFYRSDMGRELLTFSYLTTFCTIRTFNRQDLQTYLDDVKESGLWQMAQYKITKKLAQHQASGSLLNQRLLSLNYICRRPQEKMYQDYYKMDLERMSYMNWYLPKEKQGR